MTWLVKGLKGRIKGGFKASNSKKMTDSVKELLISILIRYPEVAAINFDPVKQVLKFTFIVNYILTSNEKARIKQLLLDSINVFNHLEDKQPRLSKIGYQTGEHFTIIELQRDVGTLTQEEITLIVELFQYFLKAYLITEDTKPILEEELIIQEKTINYLLENVGEVTKDRCLFAFWEEGQVLVFDK